MRPDSFIGRVRRRGWSPLFVSCVFFACTNVLGLDHPDAALEAGASGVGRPSVGRGGASGAGQGSALQGGAGRAAVETESGTASSPRAASGGTFNPSDDGESGFGTGGTSESITGAAAESSAATSGSASGGSSDASTGGVGDSAGASGSVDTAGAGGSNSDGCKASDECVNADGEHCRATCVRSGGHGDCVLSAADADNDGHGSALCLLAPEDDCDDSRSDVHPGQAEVCDGVDNDCNSKLDLLDGLGVSAVDTQLAEGVVEYGETPVAWAGAEDAYAVLWRSGSVDQENLLFQVWSAAGEPRTPVVVVNEGTPGALASDIVWSQGRFGVLWSSNWDGAIRFREVALDGSLLSPIQFLTEPDAFTDPTSVSLVPTADGAWIAAYISEFEDFGNPALARKFTTAGPLTPPFLVAVVSGWVELAIAGGALFVMYEQGGYDQTTILDDQLINSKDLPDIGEKTRIVGRAGKFGVATLVQPLAGVDLQFNFMELDSDGVTVRCGPVLADDFVPGRITTSPHGFLIFDERGNQALEVLDGCHIGQRFSLDIAGRRAFLSWPYFNADGSEKYGFALASTTRADGTTPALLHSFRFGPRFCD